MVKLYGAVRLAIAAEFYKLFGQQGFVGSAQATEPGAQVGRYIALAYIVGAWVEVFQQYAVGFLPGAKPIQHFPRCLQTGGLRVFFKVVNDLKVGRVVDYGFEVHTIGCLCR